MRNRGNWRISSEAFFTKVNAVLDGLRDYWPLTLRQVYYQLVASMVIENNLGQYKRLSKILTKARLDELVPWEAIEDRSRSMHGGGGWDDAQQYERSAVRNFLTGYSRDLMQSQDVALEVWVEKDALSQVCLRAASPFCVPVVVAKGFSSITYVNRCRERVLANRADGKLTKILYFGDLDPSGWFMLPCMMETLQYEMNLGDDIESIRCALTREQVVKHNLPRNPDAFKPKDSRAHAYRKLFGNLAVELDALRPDVLEKIVTASIRANMDKSLFEAEKKKEREDRAYLDGQRSKVMALIEGRDDDGGDEPPQAHEFTPPERFC